MTARHGRDCPDRCSQCAGAVPRRVTIDGSAVLVDGEPADRAVEAERTAKYRAYSVRGGRAKALTARPRR